MGKYKPNKPTPQYDQEFSEAMRLKLRLNREARSKGSAASASGSAPSSASASAPSSGLISRDEVIERILANTPGLTREEVEPMMREMGF
jgi:hypothetical protein